MLLAVCDSNYKFILVDIGAEGRQSDGGIWSRSAMGQAFLKGDMNIPHPEQVLEGPVLPYVLVADEAFQFTNYTMRPFPGKAGLTKEKQIFNYRLSRARRIVECAFGILVSQWRIYRRLIDTSIETAENIIKATIILHNYLHQDANNLCNIDLLDDININTPALIDLNHIGSNTNTRQASKIRNIFMNYFNNEGAVSWQETILQY